jgi:hypothetical protein
MNLNPQRYQRPSLRASTNQTFGRGLVDGDSLCSDTVWQVRAEASDNVTQAKVSVTEGVAVRVGSDVVATYCP